MKKTWTITLETKNDKWHLSRVNDGFDALELIGILELTKQEVMDQMAGLIKPDFITRQVVKKGKKNE